MDNIKIITANHKEYLSQSNLKELIDGFTSYHKTKYPKYDAHGDSTKHYTYSLNEVLNGERTNDILCLAYDTEAKRTVGVAYGGHVGENNWSLWFLYTQKNYRGKKVTDMLYSRFENEIKKREGKKLGLGVYCANDEALKFYQKKGYEIAPDFYQSKITALTSFASLLTANQKTRKNLKSKMEMLNLEKELK